MKPLKPRITTPADGLQWLAQALGLLVQRPALFVVIALISPVGSAILLTLPIWEWATRYSLWLSLFIMLICYGVPLVWTISLSCGIARAVNRQLPLTLRHWLLPGLLRVFRNAALFLFLLLVQGYLALYWIECWIHPPAAAMDFQFDFSTPFIITDTLLATELGMIGVLILVLQFALAGFVTPLYLFRELPLLTCWHYSFLAMQLNPWIIPVLGLIGLLLIAIALFEPLSIIAQLIAFPMPVYFGTLLYVAWLNVFEDGQEDQQSLEADHKKTPPIAGAVTPTAVHPHHDIKKAA